MQFANINTISKQICHVAANEMQHTLFNVKLIVKLLNAATISEKNDVIKRKAIELYVMEIVEKYSI